MYSAFKRKNARFSTGVATFTLSRVTVSFVVRWTDHRILELDARDFYFFGEDRIQEMDRDPFMSPARQHQLEREIDERTNANCHESNSSMT